MGASSVVQTPKPLPLLRKAFQITTRTRICYPQRRHVCFQVKSVKSAEPGVDELHQNFKMVPSAVLTSEKEEAKAVVTLFLRKQGLSYAAAARAINNADGFIDHLVSRLHSFYKNWYLVGRELTTIEIRNALIPYLESLLKEHGDIFVDVVENFPNPPKRKGRIAQTSPTNSTLSSKTLKAMARVTETGPPHILYLIELGMDIDQIKAITRRFPGFAYCSLDRQIRPMVEFLIDIGVPQSDIPTIFYKRPQFCTFSLSENIIPTMTYFESLGVDRTEWARVINRFPAMLTYSRHKVQALVDYLYELGLTTENIGTILTRCPQITSYSVDDNLRPTAEYFASMGVDVGSVFVRSPQTFGQSLEANLKPITEFFLQKGFSIDEVATMVSKNKSLYTLSLTENLMPKWTFFLSMDYPRSDLVKFPHYFGYSLEERIKPRYEQVRQSGVTMILNHMLSITDRDFEIVLKRKIEKMLGSQDSK